MKVSKEEYENHIKNYKEELEVLQTAIMSPPMRSHKDIITKEVIATVEMEYLDSEGNIVPDDREYNYYIKNK